MSGHCCLFLSFLSFVYHRQVDILVKCVETKDADAQTVQYLHVSRRTLRVCVYDYDCVVSH